MKLSESGIADQVRSFLTHQGELYGDELMLTRPDALCPNPNSSNQMTLEDYEKEISDCTKCSLSESRTHFVFGRGNSDANLMLIGEAPGRDEDLQGRPFVGRAGQLLDKIMSAIDFTSDDIFIGNILKCRPPNNRDPSPVEVDSCMPYLLKQIEIISPKIILALGRIAAQNLLKTNRSLGQMRGEIHDFMGVSLMVTYHPAALLRNPHWKRPVWEDVQKLRHLYDELVKDKPKWSQKKK